MGERNGKGNRLMQCQVFMKSNLLRTAVGSKRATVTRHQRGSINRIQKENKNNNDEVLHNVCEINVILASCQNIKENNKN